MLAVWLAASRSRWQTREGYGVGWYGSGYDGWGVQTVLKHVAAAATIAHFGPLGGRTDALDEARAGLRYALDGHVSGTSTLSDGNRWGHTWISALALERAGHGVALLWEGLDERERDAWIRVLASEADWLTLHYRRGSAAGITADRWGDSGRNAPESNLWNGSSLWRAASTLPDDPRAPEWQAQGVRFLANALSIPSDAEDRSVVDGVVVADQHRGPNYFPSWALDHHGYLNTGYMAVVTSQTAVMHFDLRAAGAPEPAMLQRHQAEHWNRLRLCIADDGRLLAPGGDSRTRYSYCHDLLVPGLLFASSALGDARAAAQVDGWLGLVHVEQETTTDGSFMTHRLEQLAIDRPSYLERLETDRAFALSFLAAHADRAAEGGTALDEPSPRPRDWHDDEHGFAVDRSDSRFVSFSWRAFGTATGVCIPPDRSDLGEWETNLTPGLRFEGEDRSYSGFGTGAPARRVGRRWLSRYPHGFATLGTIVEGTALGIPEGWTGGDAAVSTVGFVALPDERTVVGIHLTDVGSWRPGILESHGLNLEVPNDVYNGGVRRYRHRSGALERRREPEPGRPAREESLDDLGAWTIIDDSLGVASLDDQPLQVIGQHRRRGGALASLGVDRIVIGPTRTLRRPVPHERIVDAVWAVQTRPTAGELQDLTASVRWFERSRLLWALTFRTTDATWGVVVNLGDTSLPIPASMPTGRRDVTTGGHDERSDVPAGAVRVLLVDGDDDWEPPGR